MTALILVLLLPGAGLWAWLRVVPSMTEPQRAAAAIGFGLAGSSTTFFLWRLIGGDVTAYPMIDIVVWTAVGAAGAYRVRHMRTIDASVWAGGTLALGALVMVFTGLCGVMVVDWVLAHPYGRWDAWAVWNLRAKFLVASSGDWRNAFDAVLSWSHPDYPLLLPSAVARAWALTGGTRVAVPIAISLVFTGITVLTLVASVQASKGAVAAAMALALIAVPGFVLRGAAQMADVPLASYTLLAVTLLAVREPRVIHLALAGAAMGFAAWTKNEGLLTASALPSCYVIVRLRRDGFTVARRAAVHLAIGLAPILGLLVLFKLLLSPESDLVAALLRRDAPMSWADWPRIKLVVGSMARGAASWGDWPVGSPMWLLVVLMLAPRRRTPRPEPAVLATGLYLVVLLAAFCFVYVTTPYEVTWHLRTSWSRLIAQMWPTLVWCVCSTRGGREVANGQPAVPVTRRPAVS